MEEVKFLWRTSTATVFSVTAFGEDAVKAVLFSAAVRSADAEADLTLVFFKAKALDACSLVCH